MNAIVEQSASARITTPEQSRILATEEHLPRIDTSLLSPRFIANALARWQDIAPLTQGDGKKFAGLKVRQAAVLIGLVPRENQIKLILTQRASHLRSHAGQIAFPGGAQDGSDENAWHTAQRETMEEIGVPLSDMQYLGRCHSYATVTAFEVTPCVAWVSPFVRYKPTANEVEEVFELDLSDVLNPANHQRRIVTTPAGERTFYAIPSVDALGKHRFVWGATAGMLRNLYAVLAAPALH